MDGIVFVKRVVSFAQLKEIAERRFGDMVKAVVDVDQKVMAIGGEMHADVEAYMLDRGSKQEHLWGINMYPDLPMPDMIQFDSMINIRPKQNNKSRSVEDEQIRKQIVDVVMTLVE